jgi:hypothetical protein
MWWMPWRLQAKKDTKLTINISFDINIPKKEFINMMEVTYDNSPTIIDSVNFIGIDSLK